MSFCLEQRQPVLARLSDRDRFNPIGQRLTIPHPSRVVGERLVAGPLAMAQNAGQAAEQPLVGGAYRDVSVSAPNRLVRRVHPVRRSQRGGHAGAGEILGRLPHRQRDAGVHQRRVDLLAGAGAMTMLERRENADEREQAGAEIGDRNAGLDRRPAGLSRDRHDAGDALRDQIEPALGALRTGLAVSGNRRVNQARVRSRERGVVETERGHHAWTIILDYDVTRPREPREHVASLGRFQVQDDAALPAVDGVEGRACRCPPRPASGASNRRWAARP